MQKENIRQFNLPDYVYSSSEKREGVIQGDFLINNSNELFLELVKYKSQIKTATTLCITLNVNSFTSELFNNKEIEKEVRSWCLKDTLILIDKDIRSSELDNGTTTVNLFIIFEDESEYKPKTLKDYFLGEI